MHEHRTVVFFINPPNSNDVASDSSPDEVIVASGAQQVQR